MSREYPPYPVPSAAALVCRDVRLLLIKRKFEPGAGKWSLPGGKIEIGEKAMETAVREVMEECGIKVTVKNLLDVADAIFYDRSRRVLYHYLIVIYVAEYISGILQNSQETLDVRWVPLDEVIRYDLTGTARDALAAFVSQ